MTFTYAIYDKVCEAIPNTTTRSFSRDCGKSEGYYGSITAQKLNISTNALICLAEVLEVRKCLLRDKLTASRLGKIGVAQQMIADEVAARVQSVTSDDYIIRKMIISSVAKSIAKYDRQHYPPIFIM
jgi:hypothetical protein